MSRLHVYINDKDAHICLMDDTLKNIDSYTSKFLDAKSLLTAPASKEKIGLFLYDNEDDYDSSSIDKYMADEDYDVADYGNYGEETDSSKKLIFRLRLTGEPSRETKNVINEYLPSINEKIYDNIPIIYKKDKEKVSEDFLTKKVLLLNEGYYSFIHDFKDNGNFYYYMRLIELREHKNLEERLKKNTIKM